MPSSQTVIFLLGAVAMEETDTTYKRKIYQFQHREKGMINKITEKGEKSGLHTFLGQYRAKLVQGV